MTYQFHVSFSYMYLVCKKYILETVIAYKCTFSALRIISCLIRKRSFSYDLKNNVHAYVHCLLDTYKHVGEHVIEKFKCAL